MTTVSPPRPAMPPRPELRSRPTSPRLTTNVDPFKVLRRHLLLIIGSLILGTAIGVGAFVLFRMFYPLYGGNVLFEIRPGITDVREIGTSDVVQDQLVLRIGMTETVLLTSRNVLEAALRDREVRNTNWFRQFTTDDGTELRDDAIDELEDSLGTRVVRNTNLFELTWSTHQAADVPIVLNAISRAYMDKRKTLDEKSYAENLRVFRDQLQTTQRDIVDLDQQIAGFIRKHELTTLGDTKDSQLAYQMQQIADQITAVGSNLSMVQTAYQQAAAKLEGTVQPDSDDRYAAEQSPMIAAHDAQILAIRTELRRLYEIYQPEHPMVRRLEGELRANEGEREAKIDEIIINTLQASLKALQDQEAQLATAYERLSEEHEAKSMLLRDLAARQSEYESMRTQRDYLEAARDQDLQLIKEVHLMQLREDAARVRVTQEALPPREPAFPKPEIVVPLGALLVMSLTVGLIFLRELTDQRVKSASDLAIVPGARVLGIIPERSEDPTRAASAEMVVRKQPHSVLAESYRQAFASVAKMTDRAGHQSLLLVGGMPGAGTTTLASNLAVTWAAAGRRVVLVDANFRRPRLAEAVDAPTSGPGLGDILAGAITASEAIVDVGGGLSLIPAGSPANRVFEMLNTRQFDSLLAQLRDEFDMIVFDAPPAVVAGEALVLADKLDASLLVVRAGQEQRGLVARLVHQLSDASSEMLGIVLNRPRGTAGGYFKKNFAAMASYSAGNGD